MKKVLFVVAAAAAAFTMSSCKSQESAYRAAYEKARAYEAAQTPTTTTPVLVEQTPVVAPATTIVTTTTPTTTVPDSEFRTIKGGFSVVEGSTVNTYGVVVGSFAIQANAKSLYETLRSKGMNATVVRTNETINGQTGWYRVVAASYNNREEAAQMRDQLRQFYSGAWLLYNK